MRDGRCSLCHREIKGNVNVQKLNTCGHCVQILLTASREDKIAFREKLLAAGRLEEARAIQSFIEPKDEEEEDGGEDREIESRRSVDFGSGFIENVRLEEVGVG